MEIKTYTAAVAGEPAATLVASLLAQESMWFECMPVGDDEYRFTCRDDRARTLDRAVEIAGDRRLALQEIADRLDGILRTDYSGRAMYGNKCYGIICGSLPDCLMLAGQYGLPAPLYDNMGMDWIVYWRTISDEPKRKRQFA